MKSITMDEIARQLGVSKKTLYQHFKDKNEIVLKTAEHHIDQIHSQLIELLTTAHDPIHELILVSEHMSSIISNVSEALMYDLQRFFPDAYKIFNDHKCSEMYDVIRRNLELGVSKGLYRKDINVDILARLRVEQVSMGFDTRTFGPGKYGVKEIQLQFFDHFIHGITTIKGHKLLNKYQHINEED